MVKVIDEKSRKIQIGKTRKMTKKNVALVLT